MLLCSHLASNRLGDKFVVGLNSSLEFHFLLFLVIIVVLVGCAAPMTVQHDDRAIVDTEQLFLRLTLWKMPKMLTFVGKLDAFLSSSCLLGTLALRSNKQSEFVS